MKIRIEVICYGLILQRLLGSLDFGNKVVVVEVKNSIRPGIMIIVGAVNRVTNHPLLGDSRERVNNKES